jgi:SAM-dependent methyltransferase
MDEAVQARAYADADFSDVNRAFVERFVELFPELRRGRVVDLGCGPGDIPIRMCRALPGVSVVGIDGAESMLEIGRRDVESAGLGARIDLLCDQLPLERHRFGEMDAAISNSLLHHLHDPMVLWSTVIELTRPGAPILVVDLFRPETAEQADALVETYAKDEASILKRDFRASLHAAFTPDEVRQQLALAGLGTLSVETISDRHLEIAGYRP